MQGVIDDPNKLALTIGVGDRDKTALRLVVMTKSSIVRTRRPEVKQEDPETESFGNINPEESALSTQGGKATRLDYEEYHETVWQISQVHKVSNCKRAVMVLKQIDTTALVTVDSHQTVR